MERDGMGSEWGPPRRAPVPKRKLINLRDPHDLGGLVLYGILAAPFVWMFVKWVSGM